MTYKEAADRINATCNQDGTWTYEAKEDGNVYTLTDGDLEALAEYLTHDPMDGYSLWCAAGYGEIGGYMADMAEVDSWDK